MSNIVEKVVRERTSDMIAAKLPDDQLHKEKERLEVVLSSISDAVIITDVRGRVDYMNTVAEQLTGWKGADAQGISLDRVLHLVSEASGASVGGGRRFSPSGGAGEEGLDAALVVVGAQGTQFPIELSVASIHDGKGGSDGSVVVFRDISHSRRMAAQLIWQANHDPLTGLENRAQFEKRLEHLLDSAEREEKEHALLYLDLDQFKIVNDTCGHTAGDELLRQLTKLFKYKMRRSDTLARLGGDEFGILLESCALDPALRLANELRTLVKEFRFVWEGKVFSVGLSIGLVAVDKHSKDAASVLIAADTACYTAKDSGRNRVHVFRHGNSEAARRRGEMQWISRIHDALDNERMELYCQSIRPVDEKSGLIPHREMLLRMRDPEGGLIPPGAFIPAAERYNLMPTLDRWVVLTAFRYLGNAMMEEGEESWMLNINLSGASLVEEGFLEFVLGQLHDYRIPPELICFEITETAAIANLDEASEFITSLRHIGCKFALDDFGSGLSSFGYLKHLPVDFLKIDGGFIKDILIDPVDCAMVEAINQVGHIMGIQTVAEFVEDAEVMARLRELGVDYAQGYYIEKPHPLALSE